MLPTFNCLWVHQTTFSYFAYMLESVHTYIKSSSSASPFSAIFIFVRKENED